MRRTEQGMKNNNSLKMSKKSYQDIKREIIFYDNHFCGKETMKQTNSGTLKQLEEQDILNRKAKQLVDKFIENWEKTMIDYRRLKTLLDDPNTTNVLTLRDKFILETQIEQYSINSSIDDFFRNNMKINLCEK